MTRLSKVAAISLLAIIVGLNGCDGLHVRTVKVGDHIFQVPESHVVRGGIPWLPLNQSAGLKFVVNPEARPQEQLLVTIESTATTCHPLNPPASNMLSSACVEAERGGEERGFFNPEKVYRQGDATQWEYQVKAVDGSSRTVATCFAMADDGAGLCRSLGNYKDLVFAVGLRDRDVRRLPEIWKRVRELLASWEVERVRG